MGEVDFRGWSNLQEGDARPSRPQLRVPIDNVSGGLIVVELFSYCI